MQYGVPQFVDVEDKIVGPLTAKQTLWLMAGAGILFIAWTLADLALFIIIAVPTSVISIALAFFKPQGRPFSVYFKAAFQYFTNPRIYIWRREIFRPEIKRAIKKTKKEIIQKDVSKSRLKELAWVLDTRTAVSDNR